MIISETDLILKVSAGSIGAGEIGGPNAGPYVERVQRRTGNKRGDAWCASRVADVGVIALDERWPMPLSGAVMDLVNWAARQHCNYIPSTTGDGLPRVGDVHAIWFPKLKRWAHCGFIVGIDPTHPLRVLCDDGNTTDPDVHNANTEDDREGWLNVQKHRDLTDKDRLLRWVEKLQ